MSATVDARARDSATRVVAKPSSSHVETGCVLVTGASRGIGAATAQALAEHGWSVAVNYSRDREGAEGIAGSIEDGGGTALAVGADVSDSEAAEGMLAEAASTGLLRKGSRVLLSAFGAGLTWGAGIVEWEGAA